MSDFVKNYQVFAMTTDPVYIGTGGYTIGRVDNTIVRDPITKIPKIPGSSLAGVWRYYTVLEIFKHIKDECKSIEGRKDKEIWEIFNGVNPSVNLLQNLGLEEKEKLSYVFNALLYSAIKAYRELYIDSKFTDKSNIHEVSYTTILNCILREKLKSFNFDIDVDNEVQKPEEENIRPDLIIHKRGTNEENLIVVEAKKRNNVNSENLKRDIEKLGKYKNEKELNYKIAILLLYNNNENDVWNDYKTIIDSYKDKDAVFIVIDFKIDDESQIKFVEAKVFYKSENPILEISEKDLIPYWILSFENNRYIRIKCAGQDDEPNIELKDSKSKNSGHCGHCLVCKGFGFSKKDISWQGMIFFSDLNILFFPVFTMYGTKWITTVRRLEEAGLKPDNLSKPAEEELSSVIDFDGLKPDDLSEPVDNKVLTKNGNEGHINLGWLYLEVGGSHSVNLNGKIDFESFQLNDKDIVIVPESLFSQIVNSNLEIRTSVSIDPITGAAKEGALFTSEAIPRGTILYGNIRIFDKSSFTGIDDKLEPLPSIDNLECALKESKHFFETLGIGGMTTRGFGRLKIQIEEIKNKKCEETSSSPSDSGSQNDKQKNTQGGKQ